MLNFYKILFFFTMISGTMIAISSYSWLSIWMGLEINLMSILPLMAKSQNKYPSEAALKYFITQVFASTLLLTSLIISSSTQEFYYLNSYQFVEIIFNTSLLIKLGMAPFHAWFPEVLEGLNWSLCLIMLTWQKIAPMAILMYYCNQITFLTIIIVASTVISSILGLNQISLRKIMAYSSINHMAWMLSIMISSKLSWFWYFLIYSLITLSLVMVFSKFKIFFMKQLFNICSKNKTFSMMLMMTFLSLGGLPPFLGFLPKWIALINLTKSSFFMLSVILICFTLIVLFFYLRLTLIPFLLSKNEALSVKTKLPLKILWFQVISIISLPLCSLILTL